MSNTNTAKEIIFILLIALVAPLLIIKNADATSKNKQLPSPRMGETSPMITKIIKTHNHKSGKSEFTQYNFMVENYAEFPNELFTPAPDLPPCGKNKNSSRSWVNIYNQDGHYLYGYCALKSNVGLKDTMWFTVRKGTKRPEKIYIEINDRQENVIYMSNEFTVPYDK